MLAAAGLAACSVAFAHAGRGPARGFRLPDASAACRVEAGTLVCRSLAVPRGLALPGRGTPRAVRAPIWWDASTPVLHRFVYEGVSCRIVGQALVCRNASGAAIEVGPRQISVAL